METPNIEIFQNEPLARHTFYGIGGPANEFWHIRTPERFDEIWAETITQNIPSFVLGKGSNLLFSDKGFRGRVFSLEFNKVSWKSSPQKKGFVTVETGKNWQKFIEETNTHGFGDLCNLSGIPGNVGGAVRGNAGAFGFEIKDFIQSVEFLDENGQLQIFSCSQCKFKYRESIFKSHPKWCVIRATLKLKQEIDPKEALEHTKTLLADRWKKYPAGRSGGSFFKNPKNSFAGELLEKAGAKGDKIGHAQISDRHANFIINLEGKASQKDILELARKWKQKVFEKFDVLLEPEVMVIDEYGKKIEI